MFKPVLGLKASADPQQLASRLRYKPEVFEFYTSQEDFSKEGLKRLEEAILQVQNQTTRRIVLHQPMKYQGEFLEMIIPQILLPETYYFLEKSTNDLLELAFDHDCQVLIHGSYELKNPQVLDYYGSLENAKQTSFERLDQFSQLGGQHILFENGISPIFFFGDPSYDQEILARGYRLAFDTSHALIKARGDNQALLDSLERLKANSHHYHLVDTMGKSHDSLPLGQGITDWSGVLERLNPQASAIYEIVVKNINDPQEQLASHAFLSNLV
ncbi:sugar phosphate isomerase/epimerase [Streptococcus tangpeifui]|uniref:sugar phosphate isomerase/epimerase n=1 Tax=Streptococcus tangpeifui TaxID=2709400 RepID=UPI0013ED70B4|nr:sugar phosphate isomerase/epimerase [Streptococcus sp. ZJ373]